VADQLGSHFADAAAITLLVLASLTALGLSSGVVDPVGSVLRSLTTGLVGRAALLIPVGMVGIAIVLFARRAESKDQEGASHEKRAVLRVCVGSFLLLVACCGFLDLLNDSPRFSDGLDRLRDAGGVIGSGVVVPLSSLAGTVGAGIVLFGVFVLGLLLVPGLPMREVFARIAHAYQWTARTVLAYTELQPDERDKVLDERDGVRSSPTVHLYDQAVDDDGEPVVIDWVDGDGDGDVSRAAAAAPGCG